MVQPNILFILSDDHGYADRGILGLDDAVSTPALDRLAREGVSCSEAYVTAPICNPSRNAIITGSYPARWGSTWFGDTRFDETRTTLAERLRGLGYRTGYFGKVHYGPEQPGDRACPNHHGFDVAYYGLAGRQQGRLNYLHHSGAAVADYGPEASWRMAVQPMLDGDDEVELEGFLTAELGRRAGEFLRGGDGPWFAMVAFNAVHNFCWQLPPEELEARGLPAHADWNDADALSYADWYDGAIAPNLEHGRDYYLAQLELMDAEIGRLLDQLDADGAARDTIVVYLTDNGGSTCNYGSNAPLAGTKYTLCEGGIRVPLLARWPSGGWSGGATREGIISSLDLYPTLLAAAGDGGPADGLDGVDQGAQLAGGASARTRHHWECGFQAAVRDGALKLRIVHGDDPEARGIRRVEHAEPGDGVTLHDVGHDVAEAHDLAAERPEDVARLWALHESWLAEVGRPDLAPRHAAAVARTLARRPETGAPSVLFVCVRNGGKSQIAAALMRQLGGVEVHSAGTEPGTSLNAEACEAVAEVGAGMADQRPRPIDPALLARVDRVVVLGVEAEVVPVPGMRGTIETWLTDEPSQRGIGGMERMRLVRDDIAARVRRLHAELATPTAAERPSEGR